MAKFAQISRVPNLAKAKSIHEGLLSSGYIYFIGDPGTVASVKQKAQLIFRTNKRFFTLVTISGWEGDHLSWCQGLGEDF